MGGRHLQKHEIAVIRGDGIGIEEFFDINKIVPHDSRSIFEGGIKPLETKVFG